MCALSYFFGDTTVFYHLYSGPKNLHQLNPLYTFTVICWMSPFAILGPSSLLRAFILFLIENPVSKQCRLRLDATLCGI